MNAPEVRPPRQLELPIAQDHPLKRRLQFVVDLFKETADRFSDNDGFRLGASFSYYATFSIFPLLLLAITVVGFVVGDSELTRNELLGAIATPHSPMSETLGHTLTAMQASEGRGISAAVGVLTLIFAASGAFVEVDAALNRIWCVPVRKSVGFLGSIRVYLLERLSGLAIVAGLGVTSLASLIAGSFLTYVSGTARVWPAAMRATEIVASLVLLSFVFTLAFHFIPRSRPPMRIVAPGAILTTILLSALKEVFATYLSRLTSYSAYGVAGGFLALATWIYLSSMIIFFGAQLTRIHAEKVGFVQRCDLKPAT